MIHGLGRVRRLRLKGQSLKSAIDGDFQDGPIGLVVCQRLDPLQRLAQQYAKQIEDEHYALPKNQQPPHLYTCVAVVRDKKRASRTLVGRAISKETAILF